MNDIPTWPYGRPNPPIATPTHVRTHTHNAMQSESLLFTYSGHQFGTVSERSVAVGTGVNPQPARMVQKHSSHDERRYKQITRTPHTPFCYYPTSKTAKMSSSSFREVSYTCDSVLPLYVFPGKRV